MKINYWDHTKRQMEPMQYRSSRLIKVSGLQHTDWTFRKIIQNVREHNKHLYLVNGCSPDILDYDIPDNVLPIYHTSVLDFDWPIISLFLKEPINFSKLNKNTWYFLSSNNYGLMSAVINEMLRRRITFYVEYFKGNRTFGKLPLKFRRRAIPRWVAERFAGRCFMDHLAYSVH